MSGCVPARDEECESAVKVQGEPHRAQSTATLVPASYDNIKFKDQTAQLEPQNKIN